MVKNKLKRVLNTVGDYLRPIQSSRQSNNQGFRSGPRLEPYSTQRAQIAQYNPGTLSRYSRVDPIPSDKEVERINNDRLEQAKLSQAYENMEQSEEAQDLNLKSQHKLLIATLITALVALLSALTAIVISLNTKPPIINVESPSVNIQPPDVTIKPSITVYPTQ